MLHFTPDQVRAMSLAEIGAATDGFQELNSGGKEPPVTREEFEEMKRLYPDT
jgi:hypothetical protein